MPKLWTTELLRLLTQLGINTEEKPDIVSNKKKLIRLIQKAYKDIMDDVDKELEEQKTTLQDLRFFVKKFEGNNTGVGLAESMKKITSRPMNKSNRHHLNSSMEQLNNNRRINMMLVKRTQVLILLLQV